MHVHVHEKIGCVKYQLFGGASFALKGGIKVEIFRKSRKLDFKSSFKSFFQFFQKTTFKKSRWQYR